eukprot:1098945-Prymnesium_polylepis.1
MRGLILAPPRPSFVAWAGVLRLGRCGAPRPGGRVSQYLPSFPVLPGKLGHAARGARFVAWAGVVCDWDAVALLDQADEFP